MSSPLVPFNIYLLHLDQVNLSTTKPVTTLSLFDGTSRNFHAEGLFSQEIFGAVGDPMRQRKFSYVDIKIKVFHPLVFKILTSLKELYAEVMAGKAHAVFNKETQDLDRSNATDGHTGFHWFTTIWEQLVFKKNKSIRRTEKINLLEKYKKIALQSKVLVLPAGLRDLEIDASGREVEDEINPLYRDLISISNPIHPSFLDDDNIVHFDRARYSLQFTFNKIYELFKKTVEGKGGLIQAKWASRAVHFGTRNVISSANVRVDDLDSKHNFTFHHTMVGLYQYIKSVMPMARFEMKEYLSEYFTSTKAPAKLVDTKTLKRVDVMVKAKTFDNWMSDEGLEALFTFYGEESVRRRPVMVEGKYLALIYKSPTNQDDMGYYRVFSDIDEVPETITAQGIVDKDPRSNVKPINLTELIYLSVFHITHKTPGFVVRYPITGFGSIYPSLPYLKPTINTDRRQALDENWMVVQGKGETPCFPIESSAFLNTLSPHGARLGLLGGDNRSNS